MPIKGFVPALVIAIAAALATPASGQDAGAQATSAAPAAKKILVFGDSLTWGWVPSDPVTPSTRYPPEERWTGVMAEALGEGYDIVAEGLNGRTTDIDDPNDPKLNGASVFPALLASHEPLDLVIIMLGTNDTKSYLKRTPLEIALGAGNLVNMVHEAPGWEWTDYPPAKVLLINPPPLGKVAPAAAGDFDAAAIEKSRALPPLYAAVAKMAGEQSFDAGTVVSTDGIDGIHFSAETNRKLGEAVAAEVKRILAD